jgi:hypothetical protein
MVLQLAVKFFVLESLVCASGISSHMRYDIWYLRETTGCTLLSVSIVCGGKFTSKLLGLVGKQSVAIGHPSMQRSDHVRSGRVFKVRGKPMIVVV